MSKAIFPVFYAGNIAYYRGLMQSEVCFEICENFPKQTFRSRMLITGPNGSQLLAIPTVKTGLRRTMKDVKISYAEDWQKDHWKSLEASYRRSPYFEYYEHLFFPFYKEKKETLLEFNLELHDTILKILSLELPYSQSEKYSDYENDFRGHSFELKTEEIKQYTQVFNDRQEFAPNLSILDAIFNLGPQTTMLLK
ncbi:WbqC family protein [Salibacteraceae bacterium]|nr:WbqC family protein [Salibacteraceae bacterium]